jgi:hypothetical protein
MEVGVQVLEGDNFHIPTTSLIEEFAGIDGVVVTGEMVRTGEA